ncbi:GNAT family N-acetyltransferase [Portibacter marinus]|uniref:GNAT family N-acetyltransferase n=1 Tax=Portibacter marinus TaxID=2898660 RepID=UPI001F3F32EE|nr:GNAT family N-acetyltransferase [Portibacter marinus]
MPGTNIIDDNLSYSAYKNLSEISEEWYSLARDLGVFFSVEFLTAVENAPPSGLENRYILVYNGSDLIGLLSCQLQSFNASESIKFKPKQSLIGKVSNNVKSAFSNLINFQGIVCGSVLLTGMYAYHFIHTPDHKKQFLLAEQIMEDYRLSLNANGHRIKVTFLKDFYEDKALNNYDISETAYQEFSVQPNMILHLRPEWKHYEDYLSSFQSKYRVRAKRARKKFVGVVRKELELDDIEQNSERLYQLYRNIVDHINFNLFYLHPNYFSELKRHLKNKLRLFVYYKNNEIVAFYTCIDNLTEMNAHFLGYDPEANYEHQLYLNSLYDMVELSLQYKFTNINFSRTAMEIKSSVGAEPYEMLCYLKHQNGFINSKLSRIVSSLNPTEEWVQRKPFK